MGFSACLLFPNKAGCGYIIALYQSKAGGCLLPHLQNESVYETLEFQLSQLYFVLFHLYEKLVQ